MINKVKRSLICLGLATIAAVSAAQEPNKAAKPVATPESLKSEIEALRVAKVAWRKITWKSCLIDGLKESRDKKKPVVLWVFIDRPADDARC